MAKTYIITLDGPAGVGKSSLAQNVAQTLHLPYLDSGAMFRIIALNLGEEGLEMTESQLESELEKFNFSIIGTGADSQICNYGVPAGLEIRNEKVAKLASEYATLPVVRSFLRKAQRHIGQKISLVSEGRDMGTDVFPHATCKFFLDATPEERARRRSRQLEEAGQPADYSTILDQIISRDARDRNRKESPLRPARDAILIDTTERNLEQVLETLLAHAKRLLPKNK